jgi:hypothetical protein
MTTSNITIGSFSNDLDTIINHTKNAIIIPRNTGFANASGIFVCERVN